MLHDDWYCDYDQGHQPTHEELDWWHGIQRDQAAREATQITPPGPEPTEDDPDPITPEQKIRAALLRGEEICDVPPPEPLMGEILSMDSVAVLYGKPGGGKSLLSLDWALSIVTGSWWNGQELKKGNVLYALAEGVRGTGPRVKAWKQHNRYAGKIPDGFVWLPLSFDLREPSWAGPLAHVAADLTPSMVIIDTLNRYAPGTDEGPADMGKIIFAADLIRRMTGACVLIVHHSGKDSSAGARGHSSLLGAVDTELELKNGGDGVLTLTVTKQKDGPDGMNWRLAMTPTAESVVVAPYTGKVMDAERVGPSGRIMLDALAEVSVPGGITTAVWIKAVGDEVPERSFYRWRSRLLELGEVVNLGSDERPKYALPDFGDVVTERDRDAA